MTEEDLNCILDAGKPTPVMKIGSYIGSSPQENANHAWATLGAKMGFDWQTVLPMEGHGERFFTAVPSETPEHRAERLAREAEEKRQAEMATLRSEIIAKEARLAELERQPLTKEQHGNQ